MHSNAWGKSILRQNIIIPVVFIGPQRLRTKNTLQFLFVPYCTRIKDALQRKLTAMLYNKLNIFDFLSLKEHKCYVRFLLDHFVRNICFHEIFASEYLSNDNTANTTLQCHIIHIHTFNIVLSSFRFRTFIRFSPCTFLNLSYIFLCIVLYLFVNLFFHDFHSINFIRFPFS